MENTHLKKLVIGGVAALAVGGSIAVGAVAVASADSTTSPGPGSPSASSSTVKGKEPASTSSTGTRSDKDSRGGPAGASQDTPVTGDEATKVSAAVTAKDSAVQVTEVRKDADGSYDVVGTKDGTKVFYEVSADLTTVTARS